LQKNFYSVLNEKAARNNDHQPDGRCFLSIYPKIHFLPAAPGDKSPVQDAKPALRALCGSPDVHVRAFYPLAFAATLKTVCPDQTLQIEILCYPYLV
jgi:hypothetical protein